MSGLLEFRQRLLRQFAGFELVVLRARCCGKIGFGCGCAAEGEVGAASVVEDVGIIGRERQGGVVGFEGFIRTAEQQQGVATPVQSFGGEGDFLGVIRRQAVTQGMAAASTAGDAVVASLRSSFTRSSSTSMG